MAKNVDRCAFMPHPPDPQICSLCGSTAGPFQFETRPTGRNLELQAWPYCPACYDEYAETRLGRLVSVLVDEVMKRNGIGELSMGLETMPPAESGKLAHSKSGLPGAGKTTNSKTESLKAAGISKSEADSGRILLTNA